MIRTKSICNHEKVTGNGNLTTKTIKTPTYDHIKSVGFMDVKLIQGNEGKITVKTDENLQQWIQVKVKKTPWFWTSKTT